MAKKTYVLDTNVLLHDSEALFSFQDNDVVVPLRVVEELDTFKREGSEIGRNARRVSRSLDLLRTEGVLTNGGVELANGGRLRVAVSDPETVRALPSELAAEKADNQILAVALREQAKGGPPVVLVTKDVNLRIKAQAIELRAEDYETDKIRFDALYTGASEVEVSGAVINEFYAAGRVGVPEDVSACPNQFVTLLCGRQSALGRVAPDGSALLPLSEPARHGTWGILPRNREQRFALELLLNPEVEFVTLIGRAGTGKTLLALAAGFHCVVDQQRYARVLVSRPVIPMGRDLGFLPGDIQEKLAPWMQPIYDNVDFLLTVHDRDGKKKKGCDELVAMGWLQVEALTYIRGRSIPSQYIVVDEAQNLTPHEVKTIVTRAGEGTKVVLTGDPEQIDNPYVDASSNGLSYAVERFRNDELAGHVTLTKGERSRLAERASSLL